MLSTVDGTGGSRRRSVDRVGWSGRRPDGWQLCAIPHRKLAKRFARDGRPGARCAVRLILCSNARLSTIVPRLTPPDHARPRHCVGPCFPNPEEETMKALHVI